MEFGHYIGTARTFVCNALRRSARRLIYNTSVVLFTTLQPYIVAMYGCVPSMCGFSYPSLGVTAFEFCGKPDI